MALIGLLEPPAVGHNEIVADQLDPLQRLMGLNKSIPIVLRQQILNEQDGVLPNQLSSVVNQLLSRDPAGAIEIGVCVSVVHFAGGAIQAVGHFIRAAALLHRLSHQLQDNIGVIAGSCPAVGPAQEGLFAAQIPADHLFQVLIDLHRQFHSLLHRVGLPGGQHKFVKGLSQLGIASAVNHIEGRQGDVGQRSAPKIAVHRHLVGSSRSAQAGNGDAVNGVAAQSLFVLRSVQFQHTLVNCPLIGCIHSKQCRSNDRFHCIYGLVDTQAVKLVYIIVPEDKCLMGSYRGSGGRGAPAHAPVLRKHVYLQHGSRFAVQYLTGGNFLNYGIHHHFSSPFSGTGTYIIFRSHRLVPVLPVMTAQPAAESASKLACPRRAP